MISRRYLRVKTFQALYAYFQSEERNVKKAENELFLSLERMYDLYIFFLALGKELVHQSELKIEEVKTKRLPTENDLNPNLKFVNNAIFKLLAENTALNAQLKEKKISWSADQELVSKFLVFLRQHEVYTTYLATRETSFEEDQKLVVDIYKKVIPEFDSMLAELQDKSIFWGFDEIDFVLSMVLKTIKKFSKKSNGFDPILSLYTDYDEDVKMVKDLFRKTISNDDYNSEKISKKTQNWDVERIALVDIILMKMALTELLHFKSVPVKVTLNEYIELAKWFSSPNSKIFVNGILDKLVLELVESGELKKIGRGLLDA
ncbi:MAG: transcription antitermination factor NusB [Bacteroidetes bacterium]|nr:transcription antitermination factor NusB [Bacteroidota bacterium]